MPSQFIGSVEKGVRAQLEHGPGPATTSRSSTSSSPCVDGKAHSVDSSDAAFQTAGALAVKDAAAQRHRAAARTDRARVDITVPDAHVGAVLSDLSGRRGRVTGTEPDPTAPVGMERTVVHAEVPDAELIALRDHAALAHRGHRPLHPQFARLRPRCRRTSPPSLRDAGC